MKRCPECRRDYYDDSLAYCLDDGSVLVDGPSSSDEPATAIIGNGSEPQTRVLPAAAETTASNVPKNAANQKTLVTSVLALIVISALTIGGYLLYDRSSTRQINSIAVMPFTNDSGDPQLDYLSDGMTETLISGLSKVANLTVKARSAVFAYKGKQYTPKQVGDDLGVQAVLLGRLVERAGNINLSLELVDPKTLDVIWSEQYDRKQTDLVNLQGEIARDVSGKLRSRLTGEDQKAVTQKYTDDPEAYRLYLQARYCLNKRVGKEYDKAGDYLQQALGRDPNFALGYTGLAEFVGQRDRPKAKEYILRALAIDNDLAAAHALLGLQFSLDREWASAEREFKRALELDPNDFHTYHWYGNCLTMVGRYDEALATLDHAIALEPNLPDVRSAKSAPLVAAGRVDEGIAEIKAGMQLDPSYPWLYSQLSFVYAMLGEYAASVEARARSLELLDRPEAAARCRAAYAKGGWSAYLPELLSQTSGNFASETRRARILIEMGKKEEAIGALKEAADQGDWWLFSIKYDPAFDPIRGDARFQAVLKQFEPTQ